jgi:hypothetical protein
VQNEASGRVETDNAQSASRAQPDRVADRKQLQLRDYPPGAAAFSEVARAHRTLESVIAVPPAPAVAHLHEPRPHLARGPADGHCMSRAVLIPHEIITGENTVDLVRACAPRA